MQNTMDITITENGEGKVHTGHDAAQIERDPENYKTYYDLGETVTLPVDIAKELIKRGFATGVIAKAEAAQVNVEQLGAPPLQQAPQTAWGQPQQAPQGTNEAGLSTNPQDMMK